MTESLFYYSKCSLESNVLEEQCVLPSALQQRYYQLAAPHCTKAANILVYIYKVLSFLYDAEVRDISCHFHLARYNLDTMNVS